MGRRISSKTWAYRYLLPIGFVAGIFMRTRAMTSGFTDFGLSPIIWIILTMTDLGGAFLIAWISRFYKDVDLEQDGLRVTGYSFSEFIPFSRIRDVKQRNWPLGTPVCVYLKEEGVFGKRIGFQPVGKITHNRNHPLVAELRRLAGLDTPPIPEPPPIPSTETEG